MFVSAIIAFLDWPPHSYQHSITPSNQLILLLRQTITILIHAVIRSCFGRVLPQSLGTRTSKVGKIINPLCQIGCFNKLASNKPSPRFIASTNPRPNFHLFIYSTYQGTKSNWAGATRCRIEMVSQYHFVFCGSVVAKPSPLWKWMSRL